jgi:hypothetical protein
MTESTEAITESVMFAAEEDDGVQAPMPESGGEEMVAALDAYQDLQSSLDERMPDAIVEVQGKKFRKKIYWRAIARAFGLSVGEVAGSEEVLSSGNEDWGYKVTYRAVNKLGDYSDGDGACMHSEKHGLSGTVHNVRSHAHTRAYNRAVSNLCGFGEVSADELTRDGVKGSAPTGANGRPAEKIGAGGQRRASAGSSAPATVEPFIIETTIDAMDERSGESSKGGWTMHIVKFNRTDLESGQPDSATTFTKELAEYAESCMQREVRVQATVQQKGKYTNLLAIDEIRDNGELASEERKDEAPTLTVDDIPF